MIKALSKKILVHAGGTVALAKELRITPQAVSQWKHGVPARHVIALEEITGIPREELRPDLYPPRRVVRRAHPTPTHNQKENRV